MPCEQAPDQIHCQPEPDPNPPNSISSRPLANDDILNAYRAAEYSVLAEKLTSVGVNTTGKTKEELVQLAFTRYKVELAVLDIGNVDAKASFNNFGSGRTAWAYKPGSGVAT